MAIGLLLIQPLEVFLAKLTCMKFHFLIILIKLHSLPEEFTYMPYIAGTYVRTFITQGIINVAVLNCCMFLYFM